MLLSSQTITRSLYVLLTLFLQPCGPCDEWYAAELNSQHDFKSARFLDVQEQGIRARVANYKNFDVSLGVAYKVPGDRRLQFRGTQKIPSGAYAAIQGPSVRLNLSIGATWAFNSFSGLTPMESSGYMLTRYPGNVVRQMNIYPRNDLALEEGTEPIYGFTIEAVDETGVLNSVDFFDTAEIDVRLEQNDTQFLFLVRPTPVEGLDEAGDPNPYVPIATLDRAPSTVDVETEFGADGIAKGGAFFVDDFWFIEGERQLVDYPEEDILTARFLGISACLEDAIGILSVPTPGPSEIQGARGIIDQVFSESLTIMSSLESGMQSEIFPEYVQYKLAFNASRFIYMRSNKLSSMLLKYEDAGAISPKQVKSVTKTMDKLYQRAHVGAANLQGFRAKNLKQLGFLYPIDNRYLPVWAQQPAE